MTALTFPRFGYLPQGKGVSYFTTPIRAQLKKAKLVQLGIWPGWGTAAQMNDLIDDLRASGVFVTNYTVMSEIHNSDAAQADLRAACDANGWWLRDTTGRQLAWSTSYGAWDVNATDWTAVDGNGDRYPQWLAKRWATALAGAHFDGIKIDNVFCKPRALYYNANTSGGSSYTLINANNIDTITAVVNWALDGVGRDNWDPVVARALRQAYVAYVAALRQQFPGLAISGNADSACMSREYMGLLDSCEQEGIVGQSYGLFNNAQARDGLAALQRYKTAQLGVRSPERNLLVCGAASQATMRAGICFALMDNAIYTGPAVDATQPDEFGVDLGQQIDPPQYQATENGIWMRRFANGVALLNPTLSAQTITLPATYKRIAGTADPAVNTGADVPAGAFNLASKTGIVLLNR